MKHVIDQEKIQRYILLESWLQKQKEQNRKEEEIFKLSQELFDEQDTEFLIDAYLMPFSKIKEEVITYDSLPFSREALFYIYDLQNEYQIEMDRLIRRINIVRKINHQLLEHSINPDFTHSEQNSTDHKTTNYAIQKKFKNR